MEGKNDWLLDLKLISSLFKPVNLWAQLFLECLCRITFLFSF